MQHKQTIENVLKWQNSVTVQDQFKFLKSPQMAPFFPSKTEEIPDLKQLGLVKATHCKTSL